MIGPDELSGLALSALDHVESTGDDAELLDAILVYEMRHPDGDTEGNWHATNGRASINIGLLRMTLNALEQVERDDD